MAAASDEYDIESMNSRRYREIETQRGEQSARDARSARAPRIIRAPESSRDESSNKIMNYFDLAKDKIFPGSSKGYINKIPIYKRYPHHREKEKRL